MSLTGTLRRLWSAPAPPQLTDPSVPSIKLGARYLRGATWASPARVLLPESGAPDQDLTVTLDFYTATADGLSAPSSVTHTWDSTGTGAFWYLAWSSAVDDEQRYVRITPDLYALTMLVSASKFFGEPEQALMVWPFRLTAAGEVTMGTARFVFVPGDAGTNVSAIYAAAEAAASGDGRLSLLLHQNSEAAPRRYLSLAVDPATLTTTVVADNQDPFNGELLLEVDTAGGVVGLRSGHLVVGDSDGLYAIFNDTTGALVATGDSATPMLGATADDRVIHQSGDLVIVTDELGSTDVSASVPGAVLLGIAADAPAPRALLVGADGRVLSASRQAIAADPGPASIIPIPSVAHSLWLASDESAVFVLTADTITAYGPPAATLPNNLRAGPVAWKPADFSTRQTRF